MNNNVGKGAIVLVISGLVCKFFGGFFRLPLTNIVGIRGIAVYQLIMSIYSLSLVFVSGGVTNSLSKLVSSARARGDYKAISSYFRLALIFTLTLSAIFALVFILFSSQIASMQEAVEGDVSYKLLALLLPLGGIVGVSRGLLQGYGNMTPTAVSQVIEQVFKFAFGLIFALLFRKQGISGGVFGAVLGITISEFFACVYLGRTISKKGKYKAYGNYKKEFLSATLPLTFGGVILPLTHAVESLFVVKLLIKSGIEESVATSIYGVQTGVVGAILNFPLIISLAVASALLPTLSFLSERGDKEGQKDIVKKSIHTMWFLLIPLVAGIMAISGRLYPLVYPSAMKGYVDVAVQLTYVTGFSIICTAIMQLLVSILQANGRYKDSFVFYLIGGIAKISLLFIIAPMPNISVFAISISNLVLASVVSICVVLRLRDLIQLSFVDILLPLFSSVVMFFTVRIVLGLSLSVWTLIASIVIGGVIYFILCLPLTSKYYFQLVSKLKKRKKLGE